MYVERIAESSEQWPGSLVEFDIVFASGAITTRPYSVPDLAVGEKTELVIDPVLTTTPGQTTIRIPLMRSAGRYADLYSYEVGRESSIWIGAIAGIVILLTFISTLATIGVIGPDKRPIINNQPPINQIDVIVPTQDPTPSPQSTPDTATSPPQPTS